MKKVILSFATLAILIACAGDAKVEEKPVVNEVVATVEQQAVAVDYTIVDSSSVLNWEGSAVGKAHFGTVNYKGTVKVADGKLIGGELVFDLTTIDTKDLEGEYKNKLDGHLKAADFFNVDSFPEAKFVITKVEKSDIEGFNNFLENHDLLKGISFELSLYNKEPILHKLSHQHLYTQFWVVNVEKLPTEGVSIGKVREFAVPILIGNFIESFNF
mgnify:CR=1 FL=1